MAGARCWGRHWKDRHEETTMNKLIGIGAIGLVGFALGLSSNAARAHDEAAYFVLGTVVGSVLTQHGHRHAPVLRQYPVHYYPSHYYPSYPAPRHVVVYHGGHRYAPPPQHYYWRGDHKHRGHKHRGHDRHRRGR
jgi:hypothetical protein